MPNIVYGPLGDVRQAQIIDEVWGPGRVALLVQNIGSAALACSAARTWWATEVNQTGIWRAKSFHAQSTDGEGYVYRVEIELVPVGDDYLDEASPLFRGFSSGMMEEESDTDTTGLPLEVSYTFPADYIPRPDWRGQTMVQKKKQTRGTPTTIVERNKQVYTYFPEQFNFIKGSVNSSMWFGYASRFVKLQDVRPLKAVHSVGKPPRWTLRFTFECAQKLWDKTIYFVDPNTNETPSDVQLGYGVKTPIMHPQYDFNLLFDTSEQPLWQDIIGEEGVLPI